MIRVITRRWIPVTASRVLSKERMFLSIITALGPSSTRILSLRTECRVHNCEEANRSIDALLSPLHLDSAGLGVGGVLERARRAGAGELMELIRAALASQRRQRPESGGSGKSNQGMNQGMESLQASSDVVERGLRRTDFPSAAGMGDSIN
jgi:hypothetical protein